MIHELDLFRRSLSSITSKYASFFCKLNAIPPSQESFLSFIPVMSEDSYPKGLGCAVRESPHEKSSVFSPKK